MTSPLLSVIVPVYNVERYLRECLDSILASTFTNYELLLIDDGSTDSSGSICDDYSGKDARVKVFHKLNGGVSSARNVGMEHAQAEWITFVDADDMVAPTFLEHLYQPVKDYPDVDFVQAGFTNLRNGKLAEYDQQYDFYLGYEKQALIGRMRGHVYCKLFSVRVISQNNLRFDEIIRTAEDLQFVLDYILQVNRYVYTPEYGYYYRSDNNDSLTHSVKFQSYVESLHIFKRRFKSINDFTVHNNISEDSIRIRYEQLASLLAFTVYQLYNQQSNNQSLRISKLKYDYSAQELSCCRYCTGKLDKILFRILKNGHFWLFDSLTRFFIAGKGKRLRSLISKS